MISRKKVIALAASLSILTLLSVSAATKPKETPKPRAETRRPRYKKWSRNLVTAADRDRAHNVLDEATEHLKAHPEDLELRYFQVLAYARLGKLDKATEAAKAAVRHGLPPGRLLEGPRDLLQPLYEHEPFRKLLKAHDIRLIHGPILGDVTDTTARIWVRTAAEAKVTVSADPARGGPGVSATVRTSKDRDYTGIVMLKGLKPDTRYAYDVAIGDRRGVDPPMPEFTTAPPPGSKAKFAVGFGGGAAYIPWHEHMWTTILKRRPRAFLFLGDNVYIDTPTVPQTQRYCYYRRQSRPEYRALAARTPLYAIWDDHDFGTDDCSSSLKLDDPPWKLDVLKVFKENWVNPSYGGGPKAPGVWFSFSIGDVDFFMLDCRFYRQNPTKIKRPSMLGPAQKTWLFEKLSASRATFKVVASSVPWAEGTKGASKDTWDGFPAEREEIFSFLEAKRINGVVLLSADRHRSDAWRIKRPKGYDLYDLESSRLTNVHTHELQPGALFGYNKKCSFGLLTFDTTAADPAVTYSVVNIDNKVIHTLTLKRSQLTHRRAGSKVEVITRP